MPKKHTNYVVTAVLYSLIRNSLIHPLNPVLDTDSSAPLPSYSHQYSFHLNKQEFVTRYVLMNLCQCVTIAGPPESTDKRFANKQIVLCPCVNQTKHCTYQNCTRLISEVPLDIVQYVVEHLQETLYINLVKQNTFILFSNSRTKNILRKKKKKESFSCSFHKLYTLENKEIKQRT